MTKTSITLDINTVAEIIIKVQKYDENNSHYGCAMRDIRKNFVECKDTCKECWCEYLKILN